MAYALVGTIGVVASGGASVTPAWGTGQTRAAGNLLICWAFSGSLTDVITPTGWNDAETTGEYTGLFWRIATGGDAAPTVTTISGIATFAQLAEFSGGATSSPVDRTAFTAAVSVSPAVATAPGVDATAGELLLYIGGANYTAAATKTLTPTLTNATPVDTNNNTISSADHYDWGYGITTANAVADKLSLALTTTKINQGQVAIASFKLFVAPPAGLLPQQAHHRFPNAAQARRSVGTSRGSF